MPHNYSPRECYVCGKKFIPASMSIYKRRIEGKIHHFCSYGCLVEYEYTKASKNNLTKKTEMCYNKKGGDSINDNKSTEE